MRLTPPRIKSELGWTPAHKFEDGIRETIRWYLDNQAWVKAVLKKCLYGSAIDAPQRIVTK